MNQETDVYTNSRNAAHAYANVGLETGVVAASPHRLIVMLYEGAELAVRMAIRHMNDGDLVKKSAAISKASTIILEGLRAALDVNDYMNKRLMLAHLKNDIAPLEEVLGLLRELHQAWNQIGAADRPAAANASLHPLAA
jgi:flagellar protein FliS